MSHANIIIGIRCTTCQKPVGHLWQDWQQQLLEKGNEPSVVRAVFAKYDLRRDCCRRMLLTHTETMAKKEEGRLVRPAKHMRFKKTD